MEGWQQDLQDRFSRVRARLQEACEKSPYQQEVTMLAATKFVDAEKINYASRKLGLTHIGENRVQELLSKYDALDRDRLQIHFIGSLQTNKVKYIIDKVDMIHSVDSVKLAKEIDRQAAKIGKVMPILAEINSANEESKSGVSVEGALDFLRQLQAFPNLQLCGIMTLGKKTENNCEKHEFFSKTYQLFLDGKEKKLYNKNSNPILSMGMSDSFYEAVLDGSTLVRIGSALFGARSYVTPPESLQ
jgi:pyridoxal phosphate enzyme (YggS family)